MFNKIELKKGFFISNTGIINIYIYTRIYIYIDSAGPFYGHFFIIVDAFSKWPEVFKMSSITSSNTIKKFEELAFTFGIPVHIISRLGTAEYAFDRSMNTFRCIV